MKIQMDLSPVYFSLDYKRCVPDQQFCLVLPGLLHYSEYRPGLGTLFFNPSVPLENGYSVITFSQAFFNGS